MEKAKKYVWRQVPLFRYLWPLAAGIGSGINYPFQPAILALLVSLGICLLLAIFTKGILRSVLLHLSILIAGYSTTVCHSSSFDFRVDASHSFRGTYVFKVHGFTDQTERGYRLIGEIVKSGDSIGNELIGEKVLLNLGQDSMMDKPFTGDLISARCVPLSIQAPLNPGMFDFQNYMRNKGVKLQAFARPEDWEHIRKGTGFLSRIALIHHIALKTLTQNERWSMESAILSALLLGNKSLLERDQKSAFADAGAMHVLAVSGLHVGIIYLIVMWFTQALKRKLKTRALRMIIVIAALWLFAAITGFSPSVVRSSSMFSFMVVAMTIDRKSNVLNSMIGSAILMLLINPFYISNVGFQLSYVAVAGIVLIQPVIHKLWKPRFILVEKLWSLTAVSIAAQIATFPLAIYYFHQFPNYFLLSNWVVIPAVSVILPLGMILLGLSWVPQVYEYVEFGLYTLIHWLKQCVQWISNLPMSTLHSLEIDDFELVVLYALICTGLYFVFTKSRKTILIGLLLMCLLQGSRLQESIENRNQQSLVFYSLPKAEVIDAVQGGLIYSKIGGAFSPKTLDYYVDPFRSLINSSVVDRDSIFDLVSMHCGKTVLHLSDSLEITEAITGTDILHVRARTYQQANTILSLTEPEVVLLSTKLDWNVRSYWKKQCEMRGYEIHDLRSDGAYIVDCD